MTRFDAMPSDRRRRNLVILAGIAAASILFAFVAVKLAAGEVSSSSTPETYLPDIVLQIRNIADIHIETGKGQFDVRLLPGKGWVLPQRGNYPASFDQVRQTLVGLAALQTIEPKTSRVDWYRLVDVDIPPRGNGVYFVVRDAKGQTISSVVLGKSEDIGDPDGATGLFARKPADGQSWLVRSVFTPKGDPGDWMEKSIVAIDRARIQEVDVTPPNGPAYIVRRAKPSDADFALTVMPRGRQLAYDSAADGVASAITGFTFDDVRPASGLDVSHATRTVTKTFDGIAITTSVVQLGQDNWVELSAGGVSAIPGGNDEIAQINAKTAGWAFKLPAYKAQQFAASLESLLKPLAANGPKPGG